MTARRRWIWVWGPTILWAAFLFVMSSIPGSSIPTFPSYFQLLPGVAIDKQIHASVYAVLGMLFWRSLRMSRGIPPLRAAALAAVCATLYGITDEIHQIFTPLRSSDWRDALADAIGGTIGAFLLAAISLWWEAGRGARPGVGPGR